MGKRDIMISVIDGQGGGIGRSIVNKLRKLVAADSGVTICALGTNATATNNMIKAGADIGATEENREWPPIITDFRGLNSDRKLRIGSIFTKYHGSIHPVHAIMKVECGMTYISWFPVYQEQEADRL